MSGIAFGPGLRRLWAASAFAVACGGCLDDAVSPGVSPPEPTLEELVPGTAYAEWFETNTGIAPDADEFGVYSLEGAGEELFVGFGATLPARGDGALLASTDGTSLLPIAALDEQGFADMTASEGVLIVPGVDPCCGDDWSLGNLYTYRAADGLRKHRTLPNVVHAFGVWHDATDHLTYVSTGSHEGDETTLTGAIWRSPDRGESWTLEADRSDGVGDVRTYDVLGAAGRLFAIRSDSLSGAGCQLIVRGAGGTWRAVTGQVDAACWPRIVRLADLTLAPATSLEALHSVGSGDAAIAGALPFRFAEWAIQWAAVASGTLYAITDAGSVVRTRNLNDWTTVVTSEHLLVSIEYWAERNWLVVGGAGASTGLWKIDLTTPPPE